MRGNGDFQASATRHDAQGEAARARIFHNFNRQQFTVHFQISGAVFFLGGRFGEEC